MLRLLTQRRRNAAEEVTLKVVAAIGALFVGILALGRFELSRKERRQASSALAYSEQTLYEGHYNRAVAQLASERELVQIGGIYSMGLLYDESASHRTIVVRALCAFIRTYPECQDGPDITPEAIKSAITILREFDNLPIGLELAGSQLDFASLDGCQLCSSDFSLSSLRTATLTCVDFTWSSLRGCDLTDADITDATFDWCNLTGVILSDATVIRTSFKNAVLTNMDLSGANLDRTDFTDSTWDEDRPPIWPDGFQPPPRRQLVYGFNRLDVIRKDFLRRRMQNSGTSYLRFSAVALRAYELHYQRMLKLNDLPHAPVMPD